MPSLDSTMLEESVRKKAKHSSNGHSESKKGHAITPAKIGAVLEYAVNTGVMPSVRASSTNVFEKPVCLFYDLDAWTSNLEACQQHFGSACLHAIAVKSNPVASLLKRALDQGFAAECASIGEVLHAQAVGFPTDRIVYDAPCKTRAELHWALSNGITFNIDNFSELERVAELRKDLPQPPGSTVGLRINPLVGAGEIAALSVSTGDSKFGISSSARENIVDAYKQHKWLNALHVHTGSGAMALKTLVGGVSVAMKLALSINDAVGHRQITTLNIGGGIPANYDSDDWGTEKVPTFQEYAAALRHELPGLLSDDGTSLHFDRVTTEFGQGLNAKAGFLASRVEYVKPTADGTGQIATVHFGADVCPRQCYTTQHSRRLQLFDRSSYAVKSGEHVEQHIAGPLCFQGDMLAKSLMAPRLQEDDFVVMRDTGANCLSLFSRHCSRFAPKVMGYCLDSQGGIAEMVELKKAESLTSLLGFWGGSVPGDLARLLAERGSALAS